jgi:glycosyltransferase involved in cell wall biosynthesis
MKISVIVPLYNKSATIERTLSSVLRQTILPYEIIIVNDGSTDNSVDIVKRMDIPLIRLILTENEGVSSARNRGIKEAEGEWIAFLDADDEWLPEYLETLKYLSEKYPECSVLGTRYFLQHPDGKRNEIVLNKMPFATQDGILRKYFRVSSCSHPPLWTSAVAVKKEALEFIGGFPVGIHSGEDLLTWARLVVRCQIAYSLKPLAVFILDERISRTPQIPDMVSTCLKDLLISSGITEIRNYISFWHKMRARGYLELGYKKKAIQEIVKSLRWNLSSRVWLFIPFIFLRRNLFRKAARKFEKLNRY